MRARALMLLVARVQYVVCESDRLNGLESYTCCNVVVPTVWVEPLLRVFPLESSMAPWDPNQGSGTVITIETVDNGVGG